MKTSQPQVYLDNLMKTGIDNRTIAEIWEDGETAVGYVWVVFTDVADYDFTFAEIQDITVISEYRKKGIATLMLEHIEEIARKKGRLFCGPAPGSKTAYRKNCIPIPDSRSIVSNSKKS
jgi:ribosomal protein S18 acetylase RimI-like enzyme